MKVIREPGKEEVVELSKKELQSLLNEGVSYSAGGIEVRMRRKPDTEYWVRTYEHSGGSLYTPHLFASTNVAPANLKLTFDGETGKLKKAEVL